MAHLDDRSRGLCFGGLAKYELIAPLAPALNFTQVTTVEISGNHPRHLLKGEHWDSVFDAESNSIRINLTRAGLDLVQEARAGHPEVRVQAAISAQITAAGSPQSAGN